MKTLVITGGSSGIGLATAVLFCSRGWRVYNLSRHAGRGQLTMPESPLGQRAIAQDGPGMYWICCDVTDSASVHQAVARVLNEGAPVDLLVLSAGQGIAAPVEYTSAESARALFNLNLFGSVEVMQAVLPSMRARHAGRILAVSSVAAVYSLPYQGYYSASKAALSSLMRAMAEELRGTGVEVGCLLPGDVRTGFTASRKKDCQGVVDYPHLRRAVKQMEHDEENGLSPFTMARSLWRMATSAHTPLICISDWKYKVLCFLGRFVPCSFSNYVVGKLY